MRGILNGRGLVALVFTLFSGWMLSFPYEGQILYAFAAAEGVDPQRLILGAIAAHIAGLFVCGFIVRSVAAAKRLMLGAASLCFTASALFYVLPAALWAAVLLPTAFLAGLWVSAWGWFLKVCMPKEFRLSVIAGSLACSTLLMTPLNMTAVNLSPRLGLGFALLALLGSLPLTLRLPADIQSKRSGVRAQASAERAQSITKPLFFLCLFIAVITINAGLMFKVINPAFAHLKAFASWYWGVPYIAAVIIVALLPKSVPKSYILYAAIAMIGLSFIAFFMLDRSALSYFIINTLLLGACGVNDLFWWSILGEMLDFHENPARILGLGLSVNVAGVLTGELIAPATEALGGASGPSLLGLTIVCVALVILPILNGCLMSVMKGHAFLVTLQNLPPGEREQAVRSFAGDGVLTEREGEIAGLLLKGYTYRLIAQELYLSESTVKTHIQNIYGKLNVRNKTELIQTLAK